MIDVSFIHAKDHENDYEIQIEKDMAFIESKLSDIAYYNAKMNDLIFFEESENPEMKVYTEGVLDGLQAIGKRILDMVARIKNFFTDAIANLKEMIWGKSDTVNKIKAEINKDPKKASLQIHNLVSSGKMSVDDFKSLSGYYKEIDNVLDQLKKDSADPKSLKAKIYKAEDKVKKGAKIAVEVAGGALTIHKALQLFQQHDPSKDKSLENAQKESELRLDKISKMSRFVSNPDNKEEMEKCRTRASILAQATASVERTTQGYVKRQTKARVNLLKMMDSALRVCHIGKKDAYEKTKKDLSDQHNAVKSRNKELIKTINRRNNKLNAKDNKSGGGRNNSGNGSGNGKGGKGGKS